MTSQKDEIQALIAEIDGVLSKASPRVPWVMSGGIAEQRHLLERVRTLLVSLQPGLAANETLARAGQSSYNAPYPQPQVSVGAPTLGQFPVAQSEAQPETAQQLLQAVVQEMSYLRSSLVQPLLTDVDALRQQRDTLTLEVKQLDAQKQSLASQPMALPQQQMLIEFVQSLMGRWQSLDLGDDASLANVDPMQRLQQLQMLQGRTEQTLLTLDSTLNIVFEALDRNVQSYQDSLSRGVERMHGLGQQGELLFTALVNRLAQQLGREASSYLQASLPASDVTTTTSVPVPLAVPAIDEAVSPDAAEISPAGMAEIIADWGLPYPGTELPQQRLTLEQQQVSEFNNLEDLDLEDLDLSDLNLGEPNLNPVDLSDLEAFTDLEVNLGGSALFEQSSLSAEAVTHADLDLTLLDAIPTSLQDHSDDMRAEEIDSAMDFLEQLSSSLPDPIQATLDDEGDEAETTLPDFDGVELDASASMESNNPPADEFYLSLFGDMGLPEAVTRFEDDDRDRSRQVEVLTEEEAASFSEPLFPEVFPSLDTSMPSDDLTLSELSFLNAGNQSSENPTVVESDNDLPLFEEAMLGWPAPNDPEFAGNFGVSDDAAIDPEGVELDLPESPAVLADDLFGDTEFKTAIDSESVELDLPESPAVLADDLFGDTEFKTAIDSENVEPVSPELPAIPVDDLFAAIGLDPFDPIGSDPSDSGSGYVSPEPSPILVDDLFSDLSSAPAAQEAAQSASKQNETTLEMLADFLAEDTSASPPQGTLLSFSKEPFDGVKKSYRPSPEPPAIDRVPERLASPPTPDAATSEIQGEDSYIPAAQEENLLVSDEPSGELDFDLWLNATTLQQLSEDLSNLEGLGGIPPQESDMFRTAEGVKSPVISSDITLESLDSLFSESPTPEPFSNVPPSDRRTGKPRRPEPELPNFGSFSTSSSSVDQETTLEDLLSGFGDSDTPSPNPSPESEKKNLN